jgi:nitric oxide synthase-interacting protein
MPANTQNKQLKQQRKEYDAWLSTTAQKSQHDADTSQALAIQEFLDKDQGPAQKSTQDHAMEFSKNLKRKIDTETKEEGKKRLKEISYWLSESQPEYSEDENCKIGKGPPPPERPASPMSGQPLRLKDLIPITLLREECQDGNTNSTFSSHNPKGKCICAVSKKTITTQEVVAIKKTGVVMLKDVYETVVKRSSSNGKTMICPITGKPFKEDKDLMELVKGKSGFAASGKVEASKYIPTMT